MSAKNKKKKQYKTLLSVLANGSTGDARRLLMERTGEDARNVEDLENKLSRMYATASDKLDVEKRFAEIHPHKDFILKYVEVSAKNIAEPKSEMATTPTESTIITNTAPNVEKIDLAPPSSGNPIIGCSCRVCRGDYYSNADGEQSIATSQRSDNTALIVGMVSIVAIMGMVMYLKSSNR